MREKSYIIEVETKKFGAYADIEIYDALKKCGLKILSTRESQRLKTFKKSSRFGEKDSIEDCFKRASDLNSYGSYSGQLTSNKDLRRIVLMADYIKALEKELKCT